MTVYRRNPLLMTVMGANPGRSARRRDDPIDKAIGEAWHRLMSGIQVSIMDIPKIFRDVKLEVAGGMSVEEAVMRVGQRFQVNRNPRYRRNPSLAASLAGGLAGAAVTYAMSNPGPAFIVIDSASGVVQFRRAASGTGDIAFRACHERARDMAKKLGRSFYVFLDMHSSKVGAKMNAAMVRVMGATEVFPDGRSARGNPKGRGVAKNPLNEVEHRRIMREAITDRGMADAYAERGETFMSGQYAGRSMRGKEIAHNFSPRSNPGRYAVGEQVVIVGYFGGSDLYTSRVKAVIVESKTVTREDGSEYTAYKVSYSGGRVVGGVPEMFIQPSTGAGGGGARRGRRVYRSNPSFKGGRRKITMTIEQFAKWVKAKRDPAMWKAFLAKFRGYEKWTHGSKSRKVTLEWQNVPGMDGLWITYDGGKQPESTYIMSKGSKRKGAWKHPWDTMPDIKHDAEAGLVLTKLRGKSKISDFYHR